MEAEKIVETIGYTVKMYREETVTAVLPLQEHLLPLSNLDLLLPAVDASAYLCYKSSTKGQAFTEMVSTLKLSLAKVLVIYYPFGGELVTNSAGEPELLCNNRGVDFMEAYANIELCNLQLYNPDETVEMKLVPKKKHGVLCVQATELRCGALVLSCTFDHRISDTYSINMFLVAWAEIARLNPISAVPSFNRSLLSPRSPTCHDNALLDQLYVPLASLQPPPINSVPPPPVEEIISRIYYIKAEEVGRIQSSCRERKRSKLVAFTAYLWRIMAKAAGRFADSQACTMGIVVEGRSRLIGKEGSSMANYIGNVVSIAYNTLQTEELKKMGVGEVADTVHDCVHSTATEEHFRGMVDWVEARRREPAMTRDNCRPEKGVGEVAVVVSLGQRFRLREMEFGWGRAVFGSYHFPEWGSGAGLVMPMASVGDNGDWVVYVVLMRGLVEALESEAGDVFRRLTRIEGNMVIVMFFSLDSGRLSIVVSCPTRREYLVVKVIERLKRISFVGDWTSWTAIVF